MVLNSQPQYLQIIDTNTLNITKMVVFLNFNYSLIYLSICIYVCTWIYVYMYSFIWNINSSITSILHVFSHIHGFKAIIKNVQWLVWQCYIPLFATIITITCQNLLLHVNIILPDFLKTSQSKTKGACIILHGGMKSEFTLFYWNLKWGPTIWSSRYQVGRHGFERIEIVFN